MCYEKLNRLESKVSLRVLFLPSVSITLLSEYYMTIALPQHPATQQCPERKHLLIE